jgi:hypothetical protein
MKIHTIKVNLVNIHFKGVKVENQPCFAGISKQDLYSTIIAAGIKALS